MKDGATHHQIFLGRAMHFSSTRCYGAMWMPVFLCNEMKRPVERQVSNSFYSDNSDTGLPTTEECKARWPGREIGITILESGPRDSQTLWLLQQSSCVYISADTVLRKPSKIRPAIGKVSQKYVHCFNRHGTAASETVKKKYNLQQDKYPQVLTYGSQLYCS